MEQLEQGLEHQLQKVKEQKEAVLTRRRGIQAMVQRLVQQNNSWQHQLLQPPRSWNDIREQVLDPRAAKAIFQSKHFTTASKPTVEQVLCGQVTVELDAHLLEELMHPGRHFHEVSQVAAGNRFVYIMCARSWGSMRAKACPCCWLIVVKTTLFLVP